MPHVVRSVQSERDALSIWLYVAEHGSVNAADRVIDHLDQAIQRIAEIPTLGRVRDDIDPSLRSYLVHSYLIFYRVVDQTVEIVRIIHGARSLPRAFGIDET